MSMQNKNLYALLGNDVSGDEAEFIAPKEIVAPQKSTKKDGVPPKADKTKAKGGKPKATGNEAGAKFTNNNKSSEGPRSTQRKSSKDKKFDKHSRTGRHETKKAEHNRLGGEAESQLEGEQDAEAEVEAEAEDAEPKQQLRSAADFFAELSSSEFNKAKEASPSAVSIDEKDLVSTTVEDFLPSTKEKKLKQKAKKEKVYLDLDITVSDGFDKPERPQRSDFQKGSRKPRGDKKFADKSKSDKPAAKPVSKLTDKNFPAL